MAIKGILGSAPSKALTSASTPGTRDRNSAASVAANDSVQASCSGPSAAVQSTRCSPRAASVTLRKGPFDARMHHFMALISTAYFNV